MAGMRHSGIGEHIAFDGAGASASPFDAVNEANDETMTMANNVRSNIFIDTTS
jgi:hypothetical protein